MKGVYLIPCSCRTPYIGQTGWSINQRSQEHAIDLRHCRNFSSALAKHVENTKHHICLEDSQVLARIDHLHHRKLREAIEIEKMSNMLNKDDGWKINSSWY